MIKISILLRSIKKYAVEIGIMLTSCYIAFCSYNMFVSYENYKYTHDLAEYLVTKDIQEIPVAKSDKHKFINAILESSNYLNGFKESDAYVINQSKDYIHPFDNVDNFNILKELVLQNLLFNMTSFERHNFIMTHRLMDIHKVFNRFTMKYHEKEIPIICHSNEPSALMFSLTVKDEDESPFQFDLNDSFSDNEIFI